MHINEIERWTKTLNETMAVPSKLLKDWDRKDFNRLFTRWNIRTIVNDNDIVYMFPAMGFEKSEITVKMDGKYLVIEGETDNELAVEFNETKINYTIRVKENLSTKPKAKLERGVLSITFDKIAPAKETVNIEIE